MEKDKIRRKLDMSVETFRVGNTTREAVEREIKRYEKEYNYDGGDYFIRELDRIEQDKILSEIKFELTNYLNEFANGTKTREDVENKLKYFEDKYKYDGRDEVIKKISRIEKSKESGKKISNVLSTKVVGIIVVIFLVCLIALLIPQFVKDSKVQVNEQRPEPTTQTHDNNKEEEYTTYYNDENGNGKLDRGEGNYTTDGDGNVVDWDENNNNFE